MSNFESKYNNINAKCFPLKILLVEDGKVNQKIADTFLKSLGYECVIVENGQMALDLLKSDSFDIVLMDCHMPVMDGFETTEKIIELYSDRRPYIIALTANVEQLDVEYCFQIGMDDFLPKPLTKEDLLQTLWSLKLKKAA